MQLSQEQCALQVAMESVTGVRHAFCTCAHTHKYQCTDFYRLLWKEAQTWSTVASDTEGRPGLLPSQMQSFCLNVLQQT
jgi:hypothetical protein